MHYIKKKFIVLIIVVHTIVLLTSCNSEYNSEDSIYHGSMNEINNNSEYSEVDNDTISISILGKKTLYINKDRMNDDVYGTGQLDNRWSLNEIDDILNAIKGVWKVDDYVGFVAPTLYYSDLFDRHNNIGEDVKTRLYESYEEKIKNAKANIPDLYFSVKKYRKTHGYRDTNSNYIYTDGVHSSSISIILSTNRINDYYTIFVNRTAISGDFIAEYPVLYIQFFIRLIDDNQAIKYEPATLVITSDDRFYILINGAFYSLKNLWNLFGGTRGRSPRPTSAYKGSKYIPSDGYNLFTTSLFPTGNGHEYNRSGSSVEMSIAGGILWYLVKGGSPEKYNVGNPSYMRELNEAFELMGIPRGGSRWVSVKLGNHIP